MTGKSEVGFKHNDIQVSVVIPCYNSELYISDAIESVLLQSNSDVIKEIIIIDDGSEDQTKKVVEGYTKEYFVKYFYQKNKGPAAARNHGIQKSKGNYIAFLDSDDIWERKKIEKDLEYLKSNRHCKLVFSNVKVVDEQLHLINKNFNQIPDSNKNLIKELFLGNITMNTPTMIGETRAILEVGGFNEDMPHREDHFF
jgi:glycosyltransferase involved in cell wall biosynthesis